MVVNCQIILLVLLGVTVGCRTVMPSTAIPALAPGDGLKIAVPDFADFTQGAHSQGMDRVLPWRIEGLGAAAADEAASQLMATGRFRVQRLDGPFLGNVRPYADYDLILAGYVDTFALGAEAQPVTWFSPLSLAALLGLPALYVLERGTAELRLNLIDVRQDRGVRTIRIASRYGPVHQVRGLSNVRARREIASEQLMRQVGDQFLLKLLEWLEGR